MDWTNWIILVAFAVGYGILWAAVLSGPDEPR